MDFEASFLNVRHVLLAADSNSVYAIEMFTDLVVREWYSVSLAFF
jgi:hypothetical protein